MLYSISTVLISTLTLSSALPASLISRQVQELNQEATAEAHPRDNGATRAFTATEIRTSDNQCLSVDPLSGDFRSNLTPVQVVACDANSPNQKWDVITRGTHQDEDGQALVVSSLTNACLNFDARRPAGNQVLLFSCGGRADGSGEVANSQQFAFTGGSGPLALTPKNAAGTCVTVNNGLLDQAPCAQGDAAQQFTFGGGDAAAGGAQDGGDAQNEGAQQGGGSGADAGADDGADDDNVDDDAEDAAAPPVAETPAGACAATK